MLTGPVISSLFINLGREGERGKERKRKIKRISINPPILCIILSYFHKPNQPVNQISDKAERPSLRPITINSNILVVKSLNNKVADNSSIIRVHSGSIGVENTSHTNINLEMKEEKRGKRKKEISGG